MPTTRSSRAHRARVNVASAFSLIEVVTVLAIFLFLIAMLIPGFGVAREQVRRVICTANLQQWGAAFQYYRDEHSDYLPTEGTYMGNGIRKPGTWYNELPSYLDLPPYRDLDGANERIRNLPNMHIWICPSKNLTDTFKSSSGKNQFHYGMNNVLDGMGSESSPSRDTPELVDSGEKPLRAACFKQRPETVLMFDIAPNSMAGSPRQVATGYWRDFRGNRVARFHGDYANLLRIDGSVTNCASADLLTDPESWSGDIIWNHPGLYWGYPLR